MIRKLIGVAMLVLPLVGCQEISGFLGLEKRALVGKWDCRTTIDLSEDAQKVTMTGAGWSEFLENDRSNSEWQVTVSVPVTDLGASMDLLFEFTGTATYSFRGGKFCSTSDDVKITAKNAVALLAEAALGKVQNAIPEGSSSCYEYTLQGDRFTFYDEDQETACTRK